MGNSGSGGGGGGNSKPAKNGMYHHCYNVGFDHSSQGGNDPIGEGIDAGLCTVTKSGQAGYAAGYDHGRGGNAKPTSCRNKPRRNERPKAK